jgi:hypothetical protein
MEKAQRARCVYCRSEVAVPDAYAQGDHIKCGTCGTKHKVVRGDVVRLVLADVAPLREKLMANQALVERLQDELTGARRSFGIGANGLGVALAWFLYQVAINEQVISLGLAVSSVLVGVAAGALLEALNYLFLSKRQRIKRISSELDDARAEGRQIQKLIREAGRV